MIEDYETPWNDRGPGKSLDCTNSDCTNGWSWDIAESFPVACPQCWPPEDSLATAESIVTEWRHDI